MSRTNSDSCQSLQHELSAEAPLHLPQHTTAAVLSPIILLLYYYY